MSEVLVARVSEGEKTGRAMRAFIDLMAAADRLREEMKRQLESWDMTVSQFYVLQILHNEGPTYQGELSRRYECCRQNIRRVVGQLRRQGWVWLEDPVTAEALQGRPAHSTGGPARRILLVHLTTEGERLIREVTLKHAKVVKAEFRALEGREQVTLSRLCERLAQGDPVKFAREIMMKDPGEDDMASATRSAGTGQARDS